MFSFFKPPHVRMYNQALNNYQNVVSKIEHLNERTYNELRFATKKQLELELDDLSIIIETLVKEYPSLAYPAEKVPVTCDANILKPIDPFKEEPMKRLVRDILKYKKCMLLTTPEQKRLSVMYHNLEEKHFYELAYLPFFSKQVFKELVYDIYTNPDLNIYPLRISTPNSYYTYI